MKTIYSTDPLYRSHDILLAALSEPEAGVFVLSSGRLGTVVDGIDGMTGVVFTPASFSSVASRYVEYVDVRENYGAVYERSLPSIPTVLAKSFLDLQNWIGIKRLKYVVPGPVILRYENDDPKPLIQGMTDGILVSANSGAKPLTDLVNSLRDKGWSEGGISTLIQAIIWQVVAHAYPDVSIPAIFLVGDDSVLTAAATAQIVGGHLVEKVGQGTNRQAEEARIVEKQTAAAVLYPEHTHVLGTDRSFTLRKRGENLNYHRAETVISFGNPMLEPTDRRLFISEPAPGNLSEYFAATRLEVLQYALELWDKNTIPTQTGVSAWVARVSAYIIRNI